MKRTKTISVCRFICFILTLISLLSMLSSCFLTDYIYYEAESKEEIQTNITETLENDTLQYDYVTQYFSYWGMPKFDSNKLLWTEQVFQSYYNYGDGLPTTLEHARISAEHFLENYYSDIDRSSTTAVTDALITSYVDVIGDPYSIYRVAEVFDEYDTDMSGKFGGIGVVIEYDHQNETLMISSINIGSPAESAGFRVGDYIYAVDGVTVEEIGYLNAVYKVRGEIGTEVTVTVKRGDTLIDLVVVRAEVAEISVAYEIDEETGYGYIQVASFKENTYEQFADAVDYMEASNVPGIIFDMRNNPGGYVTTVCDMISYLVPNGQPIVSYEYKNGQYTEITSKNSKRTVKDEETGEDTLVDIGDHSISVPIVVICNEYTASAGEIFTAAARDYRNGGVIDATIVGTTTYKKGIMQSSFIYSDDGSSITLTIAYYNPPCGINYHGIGITPDVVVELGETEDTQYAAAVAELAKLIESKQ